MSGTTNSNWVGDPLQGVKSKNLKSFKKHYQEAFDPVTMSVLPSPRIGDRIRVFVNSRHKWVDAEVTGRAYRNSDGEWSIPMTYPDADSDEAMWDDTKRPNPGWII